jgi:type III secretion protein N (ATPase)
MDIVADEKHRREAGRLRELMGRYQEVELLIRVGEYKAGSDPLADEAVAKIDRINAFLRQNIEESASFQNTQNRISEIVA